MNRAQRRGNLRRRERNTAITMAKARWAHDTAQEMERERQRLEQICGVPIPELFKVGEDQGGTE